MFRNLKVIWKFVLLACLIPLVAASVSGVATIGVNQLKGQLDNMYGFMLIPIAQLDQTSLAVERIQTNLAKLQLADVTAGQRTTTLQSMQADDKAIQDVIAQYKSDWITTSSPDFTAQLKAAGKSDMQVTEANLLAQYDKTHDAWAPILAALASGQTTDLAQAETPLADMQTAIDGLVKLNLDFADFSNSAAQDSVAQSRLMDLGVALAGSIIGLAFAFALARTMTGPLSQMAGALRNLALGDLNKDTPRAVKLDLTSRTDEIGAMAKGLAGTEEFLTDMVAAAERVAGGDLTGGIAPRSEKDVMGQAFVKMIGSLSQTVGAIRSGAEQVRSASEELASASEQAGNATGQTATTIQQVATGTASQAGSSSEAVAAVDGLSREVTTIAHDAETQATAVATAGQSMAHLHQQLEDMASAARTSVSTAQQVAQAAQAGAHTVQGTVKGIEAIRESTSRVGSKVREMGDRSQEIGKIVSTIQDIADQTNLLALNAAIEAARAGEQGRGFAVVADEVRKLAEKAGSSSREIADLVRTVQRGTEEAVRATEEGAANVARGVEGARGAGQALEEILSAAQQNSQSTANIQAASAKVNELAAQVAEALRRVSSVGDKNLAATQEMTASIGDVAQSM